MFVCWWGFLEPANWKRISPYFCFDQTQLASQALDSQGYPLLILLTVTSLYRLTWFLINSVLKNIYRNLTLCVWVSIHNNFHIKIIYVMGTWSILCDGQPALNDSNSREISEWRRCSSWNKATLWTVFHITVTCLFHTCGHIICHIKLTQKMSSFMRNW